jgi:2-iminobutanoate/2-iminopropanoate deaminase
MIEYIFAPNSPAPTAPYSPAVRAGDFLFISGQAVLGDVGSATRQILTNIRAVLEAGGASLADVVRCGVYLTEVGDFQGMNAVYAEMFGSTRPARSTIIVKALPLPGAVVEIDCVAYKPK